MRPVDGAGTVLSTEPKGWVWGTQETQFPKSRVLELQVSMVMTIKMMMICFLNNA